MIRKNVTRFFVACRNIPVAGGKVALSGCQGTDFLLGLLFAGTVWVAIVFYQGASKLLRKKKKSTGKVVFSFICLSSHLWWSQAAFSLPSRGPLP